ncbi:MAG: LicD family protein [Candidatus Omnitrophica bacterium]|nr:LicD family protein [Candidatus Omnitrophota bacterium]
MEKFIYIMKGMARYILYLILGNRRFRAFDSFPFNPNQPMPEWAPQIMAKCCEALEKNNIRYRLADGTILGLYRQGGFIVHDNDIDVDILDFQNIKLLQASMKRLGMRLGRKAVYEKQVQQLAYYSKENVIFDMIFWYSNGDKICNYSEKGYKRTQPKKYFIDLDNIKYGGRPYPMPSHIEEWLVFRYGEDWQIPKTCKDDWKKECFDLNKIRGI